MPTRRRGPRKASPEAGDENPDYKALYEKALEKERAQTESMAEVKRKVEALEAERDELRDKLDRVRALVS